MDENFESLPKSTRVIYRIFDAFAGLSKRALLLSAAIVVVIGFLANGTYLVGKEQEAVKTRFGRVVQENIQPGIHYRHPIIETAHVRSVKRVLRNTIASSNANRTGFTILSGDTNLMEVSIALQYQISDLRKYLFRTHVPEEILQILLRSDLVEIFSGFSIDLILTTNRDVIEEYLHALINEKLAWYGIGIEVVELSVVEVSPILETMPSFRDVNDAISEKVQRMNKATEQGERLVAHARGQAAALIRYAEQMADERLKKAESASSVFTELLNEYRKGKTEVAITRYWQRMRSIFETASLAVINPGGTASIDINMIDSASRSMPIHGVAELAGVPSTTGSIDSMNRRPLFSTVVSEDHHSIETDSYDRFLIEGRYHNTRTERDHATFVTPRSLIFDSPSIFSHNHIARSGPVRDAIRKEPPMIVKLSEDKPSQADPTSIPTVRTNATEEVENESASTEP